MKNPAQHPGDIGIDQRRARLIGEGRDGASRVGADPGERLKLVGR